MLELLDMAKRISQKTLSAIIRRRKRISDLQTELDGLEGALKADLQAGAVVQQGLFTGYIKTWERRNVAWKEIVVREKGKEYADRVLAGTKADKHESLVVEVG